MWQTIWLVAKSWDNVWVVIWSWKNENAIPEISENTICIQLNNNIWEIILYLQANPYRFKTKNTNSLVFISTLLNK